MSRPVLVDLFCGAGGATRGYQEAGFYVVGVDIKPQPDYVGDEFWQGDALQFLAHEFSVVWRWKTDPYRDEFGEERRKVYKTKAGATRLIAKLTSNGGHYEKHTETGETRYDDGLVIERWTLDYARLECRVVGSWVPA